MVKVQRQLRLLQLNICGISDRSHLALTNYLSHNKVDLAFLSETKTETLKTNQITPGYVYLFKKNSNSTSGGVALVLRNSAQYSRILNLESNVVDALFCIVHFGRKSILFCSVYIQPNNTTQLKTFLNQIDKALTEMNNLGCEEFCIIGDLNARHQSWFDHSNNRAGNLLFNHITSNDLFVTNLHHISTFLCLEGSSVIDLFISTKPLANTINNQFVDDTTELFTGAPIRGHLPVITEIFLDNPIISNRGQTMFDWKSVNWDSYCSAVDTTIGTELINLLLYNNPTQLWSWLNGTLNQLNKVHVPVKKVSRHSKPYWNDNLSLLSQEVREARKRFKYRSNEFNKTRLDNAKLAFSDALNAAQTQFIEKQSENINTAKPDKFWNNFKKTFYNNNKNPMGNLKDECGNILRDNKDKADALYRGMFLGQHLDDPNLDKEWHDKISQHPTTNPILSHISSFFSPHLSDKITKCELDCAVKTTDQNKTNADPDGFHPKLIKYSKPLFRILLLHIFNLVMKTGEWPWKTGVVTFLPKPGKDSTLINAYRPITLTSYIGKLLERILETRIKNHIEANNLLPTFQHGFRKNYSTDTYLFHLLSYVEHHKKSRHKVAALFLDFQKAFDSIWLEGMLYRLEEIGIPSTLLKVFRGFLCNRTIKLKINDYCSEDKPHTIGLPQGSVLSPIFFSIFIRDMIDTDTNLKPLQYADDATILFDSKDSHTLCSQINTTAATIHQWLLRWRLKLNCTKTFLMFFNPDGNETPVKISDSIISPCTETKVLGITIDHKLTFSSHKQQAQHTMQRKWNMLLPFLNTLTPKTLRTIYTSVIKPSGFYCSHLWDLDGQLSTYSFLKGITNAPHNPPEEFLHMATGILPTRFHHTKSRLNLFKRLFLTNQIPWEYKNSPLFKICIADVCRLEDTRVLSKGDINAKAFSKTRISKHIRNLWTVSWARFFNTQNYGVLFTTATIKPDIFFKTPLPLDLKRKDFGSLCALLSGHSRLQTHMFLLNLTHTPLCRCWKGDETVEHFLFQCELNDQQRMLHNPRIGDWSSIINFIKSCHHAP